MIVLTVTVSTVRYKKPNASESEFKMKIESMLENVQLSDSGPSGGVSGDLLIRVNPGLGMPKKVYRFFLFFSPGKVSYASKYSGSEQILSAITANTRETPDKLDVRPMFFESFMLAFKDLDAAYLNNELNS